MNGQLKKARINICSLRRCFIKLLDKLQTEQINLQSGLDLCLLQWAFSTNLKFFLGNFILLCKKLLYNLDWPLVGDMFERHCIFAHLIIYQ